MWMMRICTRVLLFGCRVCVTPYIHTYICIHIYTYTSHVICTYSHGSVYTHTVFTFDFQLSDNFYLWLFWSNELCLSVPNYMYYTTMINTEQVIQYGHTYVTYLHRYTCTYTVIHPCESSSDSNFIRTNSIPLLVRLQIHQVSKMDFDFETSTLSHVFLLMITNQED
jgi:hypothetical protein